MNIPDPPSEQEMLDNRASVISQEQALFNDVKTHPGRTCLHLGCGDRVLDGFINVDKYTVKPGIENYDIYKLPNWDSSVDLIFNAHVIEHLPIRHSKMAIKEWGRVVKPGGRIYMGLPDMDLIMMALLNPDIDVYSRRWYMYTLFGFQVSAADRDEPDKLDYPVDPGQFHTCGFNKKTIRAELEKNNFEINQMMNYDGYGTPSIWVVARWCHPKVS